MSQLAEILKGAVQESFPVLAECELEIVKAKDPSFGNYQCNSAMRLAKQAGCSPREVAEGIAKIAAADPMLEKVEVAGPGFINMTLSQSFLTQRIETLFSSQEMVSKNKHLEKVVIDFSGPNIAKEMHVGHLRSTIIGDCLSRVFELLGADVLRLNHVGDWGTSFGMLIEHIKSQDDFSIERVSQYALSDLMRLYRESKARFDSDPLFRKEAQLEVVALQGGEQEARAIWKIICDISEQAYGQIYDLLDVKIEVRGESFYNEMLPQIIKELEKKELILVSDGAKCLFPDGFFNREGSPLPLMMQKSDGGYTYDTTDMAALCHRICEQKADRIIYITDSGQATHFKMLFQAGRDAGIVGDVRLDHVPFGLVLGQDGKKFKTRSGETERLIDLLEAAVAHAERLLHERNPEWSPEDRTVVAKTLGIGAVKYADLSSHRGSDYCFSYDRMLKFEGNTAAFIMYSYVRCSSIQRRIGKEGPESICSFDLSHPSEISLATTLCQFVETLDEVTESLLPNRLTDYLYGLAEAFNRFFRDCRVEGDPRQDSRLVLVSLTARTLKKGLELLGIKVPPRM